VISSGNSTVLTMTIPRAAVKAAAVAAGVMDDLRK
jgi:hypothetical protein